MSERFEVHPGHPQKRLIHRACEMLRDGAVAVYPTDSTYALGCRLGDKAALERICAIRGLRPGHDFTLICRDLSEIATYAKVGNTAFRLLKAATPGPYTFILAGTKDVPRRLLHPKRKTIGLRVPDHTVAQALLAELGEPMLTTSLILPGDDTALSDPDEIVRRIGKRVDLILDCGSCGIEPTTVVDLREGQVEVIRVGRGDLAPLNA